LKDGVQADFSTNVLAVKRVPHPQPLPIAKNGDGEGRIMAEPSIHRNDEEALAGGYFIL
jgi:hypothetical protein